MIITNLKNEEIKAMKETHYKKIKEMCYTYYDNEICYKHAFLEKTINSVQELLNPFVDNRIVELNRLIDNLVKERDRIIEIDKLEVKDGTMDTFTR